MVDSILFAVQIESRTKIYDTYFMSCKLVYPTDQNLCMCNTNMVIFCLCLTTVYNKLCVYGQQLLFLGFLLKRINWELKLGWGSPDWGRGGTESGRAARRCWSAPANGGWLPGPPEGPGGPNCLGLAPCLHCGTGSGHKKRKRWAEVNNNNKS